MNANFITSNANISSLTGSYANSVSTNLGILNSFSTNTINKLSSIVSSLQSTISVAKWANYPAISSIQMSNNSIVNLSNLTFSNIQSGTSQPLLTLNYNVKTVDDYSSRTCLTYNDIGFLRRGNATNTVATFNQYQTSYYRGNDDFITTIYPEFSNGYMLYEFKSQDGAFDIIKPIASDWSLFQAEHTVDLSQNDLIGVNNFSNNASYYYDINTSNFIEFRYAPNNYFSYYDINTSNFIPIASEWSQFGASQNVEIDNFNLLNINTAYTSNIGFYNPFMSNNSILSYTGSFQITDSNSNSFPQLSYYPEGGGILRYLAQDWSYYNAEVDLSMNNLNINNANVVSMNALQFPNLNQIFGSNDGILYIQNSTSFCNNSIGNIDSIYVDYINRNQNGNITIYSDINMSYYSISNASNISVNYDISANRIFTSSINTLATQLQDLSNNSTINTALLTSEAFYDSPGNFSNFYTISANKYPFIIRDISSNTLGIISDILVLGNLYGANFSPYFNSNSILSYNNGLTSQAVASDWYLYSPQATIDWNYQNLINAGLVDTRNLTLEDAGSGSNGNLTYSGTSNDVLLNGIPVSATWSNNISGTINYNNSVISNINTVYVNGSVVNTGGGSELDNFATWVLDGYGTGSPSYVTYNGNRLEYIIGGSGVQQVANLNDITALSNNTIHYVSSTTISTNKTVANATSNIVSYTNISLANGTYNIQYYYNALNHNNNNFSIVAQLSNSTRGIIYYDSNAGANITTTYIAKSGITSVFSTQNYTFTLQVISQSGNTVTLSNACVVISKLPI